ncbi:hypothetical protein EWB00_006921 [Schistosoma japonicum]|uniref:Uncharacterized protein n=1 Tax=Schistosoma japonicum TaxID=6182 RepID=A0A4Z2CWR6_SCHJA|nr:hypothetical protein EWB00_006921 [Schistosoma japonicum]
MKVILNCVYLISLCIYWIQYTDCAGILWNNNSTSTPVMRRENITTTHKSIVPITEIQGPFVVHENRYTLVRKPKLVCKQKHGVIKCYVNEGTHVQHFNGKILLWSLLTINFVYLFLSS